MVFIPAILVAGFALFVQILRYEPLFPKKADTPPAEEFSIPVTAADPIMGVKRAGKTIVAFEDFGCNSCKQYDEILSQLVALHPTGVKIIWKGLPVTRFPYPSEPALKYAFCAYKQEKFNEFRTQAFALSDQLSENTLKKIAADIKLDTDELEECLASPAAEEHIIQNKNLAALLNIQAVPTFFINNKQVEGPQTVDGWETLLGIAPNL